MHSITSRFVGVNARLLNSSVAGRIKWPAAPRVALAVDRHSARTLDPRGRFVAINIRIPFGKIGAGGMLPQALRRTLFTNGYYTVKVFFVVSGFLNHHQRASSLGRTAATPYGLTSCFADRDSNRR